MGLYRERGSDFWWCRFTVAGTEHRKSTRTTDRRAAQVEERRLRAYYESKAPARRAPGQRGLADVAGLDVERAAANGATEAHREALVYQWSKITAILGVDTDPRTLTYDVVQSYVAKRREQGALGQTIAREVTALHRGCKLAHRRGWLPMVLDDWPTVRRDPKGTKRAGKFHPPQVLSAWLSLLPQDARDQAELAVLTSLRDAELGRVTAQWIEPAPEGSDVAAVLRVPGRSAKGRREKLLPLVPRALEILRRRAALVPAGSPLLPGSHKRAFATARRKLGYQPTISLRDLRHTWATLAASGTGVDAARSVLGHASLATTSRYVHESLARGAQAALAVEGLLGRGDSAEGGKVERAMGLEPTTLSLGSRALAALEHVTTCKYCQERALAHANLRVIPGQVGRGESAEAEADATGGRR